MDTEIGERIREARLAKHLSIRALHRETGVSIGTIRDIESGKRRPYPHTLSRLTERLGLDAAGTPVSSGAGS